MCTELCPIVKFCDITYECMDWPEISIHWPTLLWIVRWQGKFPTIVTEQTIVGSCLADRCQLNQTGTDSWHGKTFRSNNKKFHDILKVFRKKARTMLKEKDRRWCVSQSFSDHPKGIHLAVIGEKSAVVNTWETHPANHNLSWIKLPGWWVRKNIDKL